MEISSIPRSFWHSVSFCIVVATIGIIIISYRASSVSIEIANTKISLYSAVTGVKKVSENLEIENKMLIKINNSLKKQVSFLQENSKINSKEIGATKLDNILKSLEMNNKILQSSILRSSILRSSMLKSSNPSNWIIKDYSIKK